MQLGPQLALGWVTFEVLQWMLGEKSQELRYGGPLSYHFNHILLESKKESYKGKRKEGKNGSRTSGKM